MDLNRSGRFGARSISNCSSRFCKRRFAFASAPTLLMPRSLSIVAMREIQCCTAASIALYRSGRFDARAITNCSSRVCKRWFTFPLALSLIPTFFSIVEMREIQVCNACSIASTLSGNFGVFKSLSIGTARSG